MSVFMTVFIRSAAAGAILAALLGLAPTGAAAAPGAKGPPPITLAPLVHEVQSCGNIRAFCRGRHGRGPDYGNCVRVRGCRPLPRRTPYCQRVFNRCAGAYVPGRQPFRNCMRRNGC